MIRLGYLVLFSFLLNGCVSTGSPISSEKTGQAAENDTPGLRSAPTSASGITVSRSNVKGRAYIVLTTLDISVESSTLFSKGPTIALADEKLKKEAAKIGADAVIQATYGSVHSKWFFSGTMHATGVAIKFILY